MMKLIYILPACFQTLLRATFFEPHCSFDQRVRIALYDVLAPLCFPVSGLVIIEDLSSAVGTYRTASEITLRRGRLKLSSF